MSSILKALKKLESQKSQRDELSTAVASDILRSSREKKRHTVLYIAIGCFIVVLIAIAGYLVANQVHTPQPVQATSKAATFPADSSAATVTTLPAKLSQTEPVKPVLVPNLPQLSGIIYQPVPEDRLAIINDLPVMEGTLVNDFEVKTIFPDRVVLQRGSSEYTLFLNQ